MKCLFCTSESFPFAMSGGLGDVSGSLPHSLRQRLIGCRVVMPLYSSIKQEFKDIMRFIKYIYVPVSWRSQYCGIFEARYKGVIYYFIDNEYYFNRQNLYGYYDDAERFAFLSRATLEILPHIDFKPDIIHCNDWQTALIPVYYDLFYSCNDFYRDIKTVFTIHNIEYQGKYGMDILEDVVGIPYDRKSLVEFDNCLNFMKGAIEASNRVTTVSNTYAQEIMDPWYSYNLHPILRQRAYKVSGILNGIDTDNYNPKTDKDIYSNYELNNISNKIINKIELQKRLNLNQDESVPMIGMVTRMVSHKGIDLVRTILDKLMYEEDVQFVILGSGEFEYEAFFKMMQERYKGRVCACFGFVPELSRKIYAASDIFLMPSRSEPCGLSQMIALRYGSIPVVRETGGLKDTVFDSGDGEGNGFTFKNYDAYDMLNSIKRAIMGYKNKEGFNILVKRAMSYDNSWGKSANEYIKLYRSLVNN